MYTKIQHSANKFLWSAKFWSTSMTSSSVKSKKKNLKSVKSTICLIKCNLYIICICLRSNKIILKTPKLDSFLLYCVNKLLYLKYLFHFEWNFREKRMVYKTIIDSINSIEIIICMLSFFYCLYGQRRDKTYFLFKENSQ